MNQLGKKTILILLILVMMCFKLHAENTVLSYPEYSSDYKLGVLPEFEQNQWQAAEKIAVQIQQKWQSKAVTIPWTELALSHYVKHKMAPSRGARGLALLHVAMFDALKLAQSQKVDSQLCVSMAAATVMGYLFPAEERGYLRMAHSLAKTNESAGDIQASSHEALRLGQFIGHHIVQYALNDGAQYGWNGKRLQWYGEGRYYGPGSWQPTAPYFYLPPDEPFAQQWQPWVLAHPAEFRSQKPPDYGSNEFIKALQEVIIVGQNLTDQQRLEAEFWVDGNGSVTPAGHWNQVAIKLLKSNDMDDISTARLFMQLNVTLADTFIAAWDSKYHYWTIRPETAAEKILGLKFKPYILTPPFPSYVSGHAATSGAAAAILAENFPKEHDSIISMGESAAMSRLYGGIHFRFDNDEGLKLGRKVAAKVMQYKFNQSNNLPSREISGSHTQ